MFKLSRRSLVVGTSCATAAIALIGTAIPYITGTTSGGGGGPLAAPGATDAGLTSLANSDGAVQGLMTVSKLLGVVVLVLAALSVANEYTHGTLKNLLVRHPHRATLMGGKFSALAINAGALALWASGVGVAASFVLAPLNGVDLGQWTTTSGVGSIATTAASLVLSNLAYASMGALLAVILRAPATSIGIGVAWVLLGEQLIGSLADAVVDISAWFPATLANGLVGEAQLATMDSTLALAGWVTAFVAIAVTTFARREVEA